MVHAGEIHQLEVVRKERDCLLLNGKNLGTIPLYSVANEGYELGETIEVFVYYHKNKLVATKQKPLATLGEIAWLEVISVAPFGAFLKWGIEKDLFVPKQEQRAPMRVGGVYPVLLVTDEQTGRTIGTNRFNHLLDVIPHELIVDEVVELQIYRETNIGFIAIINNEHTGLLYKTELFRNLSIGDRIQGFVKKIREDGKIDLALQESGHQDDLTTQIINLLKFSDGFLAMSDRTPKEKVYDTFGVSKKRFKRALGGLYRNHIIVFQDDGIHLLSEEDRAALKAEKEKEEAAAKKESRKKAERPIKPVKTVRDHSRKKPAPRDRRDQKPAQKPVQKKEQQEKQPKPQPQKQEEVLHDDDFIITRKK